MNYLVTLDSINKDIINCTLCNRLVKYTQLVGKNKVKRFSNQIYWSKPVTGFGDPNAKVHDNWSGASCSRRQQDWQVVYWRSFRTVAN